MFVSQSQGGRSRWIPGARPRLASLEESVRSRPRKTLAHKTRWMAPEDDGKICPLASKQGHMQLHAHMHICLQQIRKWVEYTPAVSKYCTTKSWASAAAGAHGKVLEPTLHVLRADCSLHVSVSNGSFCIIAVMRYSILVYSKMDVVFIPNSQGWRKSSKCTSGF